MIGPWKTLARDSQKPPERMFGRPGVASLLPALIMLLTFLSMFPKGLRRGQWANCMRKRLFSVEMRSSGRV